MDESASSLSAGYLLLLCEPQVPSLLMGYSYGQGCFLKTDAKAPTELLDCRQKAENVVFQLCHIFTMGEVCLHRIFRACYGNQLEVDLIAILGGRHCYIGAWFA